MKINFRKRLYLVFIVSQLILVIILVYSSKISFEKLKSSLLEKRIESFKNSFSHELHFQERELSIIAENLKYNTELINYFDNIIKKKPIAKNDFYEKFKLKYQINIIEIGDYKGNVLYRFHRPADKGDNKFNQKIIRNAIDGTSSSMIEYGHSGLALRYATQFINNTTILVGKKLDTIFLNSLQKGDVRAIFLFENLKILDFSDEILFNELKEILPSVQSEDGLINNFTFSKQSKYLNFNGKDYLCIILNYNIIHNEEKSNLSFYILYDDTQITNKQNNLISDIVVISIVVMIFSIIISYIQISNESEKLEKTELYLDEVEKKLLKSEKIGALGKLVDGFSHKLNSPTAAIIANINNVDYYSMKFNKYIIDDIRNLKDNNLVYLNLELEKLNLPNEKSQSKKSERELKKLIKNFIKLNYPNTYEAIEDLDNKFLSIGLYDLEILKIYMNSMSIDELNRFLNILEYFSNMKRNIININKAASKSMDFIKSLKFFSNKGDYGNKESTNLLQLFNEELEKFNYLFESRIELQLRIDPNIIISCYLSDFKRAINELVYNAIQAIEGAGKIIISGNIRGSELEILIKDNGKGIPIDLSQKLFEPFISTKNDGEGIGLGLYITKKIIEMHNGNIIYFSHDLLTVFQITLPI